MTKIEGVIFDWAGTTVDFGCFAPVHVFIAIFEDAGIEVTMEEARRPMGMLKIDHIRTMLEMPRIYSLWEEKYNRPFTEEDVERLYAEFEPALMVSLENYTDPIPGVVETVELLKKEGLKVGSTTGYTHSMMNVVVPNAKEKGYAPDVYVTADDTDSVGRPYPYMIYRNMERLALRTAWRLVKVGDTVSDIKEGVNAGLWSVGVVVGSSEMGLNMEDYNGLTQRDKEKEIARTVKKFMDSGADFTIETIDELPRLLETINELIAKGKRPGYQ